MKWLVIAFCLMFLMSVQRRARLGYIIAFIAVLYVFGLAGCATERPAPTPSTGQICTDAGEYVLIRCPR